MSSQGEVDTNEEGEIQVETVRILKNGGELWNHMLSFTISNCSLLRNR